MAKQQRKKLPKKILAERWQYVEGLFSQGLSINEVNKKVVAKYKRSLNWNTYRKIQQRIVGDEVTPETSEEPEQEDYGAALVSVQPIKKVTQRLRMRLQGVVNDMRKNGIDRLMIEATGAVQVVYAPAEDIFDLEG